MNISLFNHLESDFHGVNSIIGCKKKKKNHSEFSLLKTDYFTGCKSERFLISLFETCRNPCKSSPVSLLDNL